MNGLAGPATGVRWLMFNGVGLLGALVQLAALAFLVHVAQVNYLVATAFAVEAAVLHNFAWHQRWTWRDRAAGMDRRAARAALGRFHLANGLVSVAGNVALMALLVGALRVPPLAANLIAILACSIVNFALGDEWVFVARVRTQSECSWPQASSRRAHGQLTVAAVGSTRTPARSRCTSG